MSRLRSARGRAGRTRRTAGTAALAGLVLASSVGAGVAGLGSASAVEPGAERAVVAKKAKVRVTMRAAAGVPAQVLLRGRDKPVVLKETERRRTTVTVRVRAGRYRVKPATVVHEGISYATTLSKRSVRARPGSLARVSVRWKPVPPPAGIEVLGTTRDAVDLTWGSGRGVAYELRKATGDVAPATRSQGRELYRGDATEFTDTGLAEGSRHAYSLFTQVVTRTTGDRTRKKWLGPVTVTAGTVRTDPITGGDSAQYSLAKGSTIVDPEDPDRVALRADGVWVTLAPSRPAPVLGAGMTLPASDELPGGYVGAVDLIAADGRTVHLAAAGIGDVFDHFAVSGVFESDPVDMDPVEYGTYDPDTEPTDPPAPETLSPREALRRAQAETEAAQRDGKSAAPARAATSESCLSYNASDLRVGIDPTFDATGDFDVLVHTKTVGLWKLEVEIAHAASVDVSSAVTVGALFDVEIKKELSCFLGLDDFYKQVVAYPVPMGLRYSGGLDIRGYGKLSLQDFGFTSTAGFDSYMRIGTESDAGGDTYVEGETYDPVVEGEIGMEAALAGELTFGPAAGTKEAGVIAGVNGTVDLARVGVAGQFGNPSSGQERCLDISFGGAADLNLKAEAWLGALEASKTFELWNEEWDYVDPYRYPAGCVKDEELGDGDIRATLRWSNGTDYDLHVVAPNGEHVWYGGPTVPSGGALDQDVIPGCSEETADGSWIENVNWPDGSALVGTYQVYVDDYSSCGTGSRTWALSVHVDGRQVVYETGAGDSPPFTFEIPEP